MGTPDQPEVQDSIKIQEKYAFLIGVSDYMDCSHLNPREMPEIVEDTLRLQSCLVNYCDVHDNVRYIDSGYGGYVQRNDCYVELEKFVRQIDTDDLLILFFSGHGDRDGLLFSDASEDKEKGIFRYAELAQLIKSSPGYTLLILDCCYAGSSVDDYSYGLKQLTEDRNGEGGDAGKLAVLYSCNRRKRSPANRLFVDKIIFALSQGDTTLGDIDDSVKNMFMTNDRKNDQTPKLMCTGAMRNIKIALGLKEILEYERGKFAQEKKDLYTVLKWILTCGGILVVICIGLLLYFKPIITPNEYAEYKEYKVEKPKYEAYKKVRMFDDVQKTNENNYHYLYYNDIAFCASRRIVVGEYNNNKFSFNPEKKLSRRDAFTMLANSGVYAREPRHGQKDHIPVFMKNYDYTNEIYDKLEILFQYGIIYKEDFKLKINNELMDSDAISSDQTLQNKYVYGPVDREEIALWIYRMITPVNDGKMSSDDIWYHLIKKGVLDSEVDKNGVITRGEFCRWMKNAIICAPKME